MSKVNSKSSKNLKHITANNPSSQISTGINKPKKKKSTSNVIFNPKTKTLKKIPATKPPTKSTLFNPKPANQLPDNFFEKMLECEIKLKEKFQPKIFYELINYYSSAIQYYDYTSDPKCAIYNQSLNLLFCRPEVQQFMRGKNMTKMDRLNEVKKQMRQVEKKITDEKVKSSYSNIKNKNKENKENVNKLMNNEIDKQTDNFKKRLEAKKKKYKLSTSDITDAINIQRKKEFDENNNIGGFNQSFGNNNDKNNLNKSVDFVKPKQEDDINNNFNNNILDELKKEDAMNELDDSFEKKLESFADSSKFLIEMSKNVKMTNKTKFLEKMKMNFDVYISSYFDFFTDKITNYISKEYEDSYKELSQKLCETEVNFFKQKKEMEYLINNDNDDGYRNQIEGIIGQLTEEQKSTEDKIYAENNEKLEKINFKYISSLNNTRYHSLEMLKEKFKLDITKSMNDFLLK